MEHILDPQPLTVEQAKIIGPNVEEFLQSIKMQTSDDGQIKVDQKRVEMCLTLAAQIPSLVEIIRKLDAENQELRSQQAN
mgnify:CR=1 FL=1|tara:strand:- start:54173 stop:54412 length:240 start_codon:yes stop_codon:yes gene_type:complete